MTNFEFHELEMKSGCFYHDQYWIQQQKSRNYLFYSKRIVTGSYFSVNIRKLIKLKPNKLFKNFQNMLQKCIDFFVFDNFQDKEKHEIIF